MPAPENNIAVKWIRIAFINFSIVALLGVTMRYKIAYYLPFIEQEHFLHAHSNFAFSGWVTQILMVLMWAFLYNYLPADSLKKYKRIVLANLLCAYGMLASLLWEGYGFISISFSTLSIAVAYLFAITFWMDLNKIKVKTISSYWFKAALVFNILSSFGAFFISYMMVNRIQQPKIFLASTFYFLHFQYNGWFFFACMGLMSRVIDKLNIGFSSQKKVFWLFATACIPAYFLSALWMQIPAWIYLLVILAAVAQLLGWILLLRTIILNKANTFTNISAITKWLFILPAVALSIKLLLQVGSTVPLLSKLAFGFRPVVIGYLHLMFLGVISLFIIGFCKINRLIILNRTGNIGIIILVSGIILNELFLMVQGLSYMNYLTVPYVNGLLLGAAICMFCGVLLLNIGLRKRNYSDGDFQKINT